MIQVKFSRTTNYTGRNGYFKLCGVELLRLLQNDSIMLTAISSKGIARCDMEIPNEAIPDLIAALQEVHSKNVERANRNIACQQ
jgi:hypothetical protein